MSCLKKDSVSKLTQVKKGIIIDLVAQVYPDMEVGKFTAMPYRAVQSYLVRVAPSMILWRIKTPSDTPSKKHGKLV